jgi:hypothetical protein
MGAFVKIILVLLCIIVVLGFLVATEGGDRER